MCYPVFRRIETLVTGDDFREEARKYASIITDTKNLGLQADLRKLALLFEAEGAKRDMEVVANGCGPYRQAGSR